MRAFVLERPEQMMLTDSAPYPLPEKPYGAVLEPVVVVPYSPDVSAVYGGDSKKSGNLTLGHECIAWVETAASRVWDPQVSDLVAVPVITPDRRSVEIQEGNDRHAGRPFSGNVFGRSTPDVFAEAFGIAGADTTFAKLPEGVCLEDALMYVDMMTMDFTDVEATELRFGGTAVVPGTDAVGLMAMQGVVLQGTAEIYAVSTREISVRHVLEFGAAEVPNYEDSDIREQIMVRIGGRGADVVFTCDGSDGILQEAVDMVRYDIGRVVNLKHYPGDDDIGIPRFFSDRGMAGEAVHLRLCRGGKTRMERLLCFVKAGKIEPGRTVTYKLKGSPALTEELELMWRKPQDLIKVMVRLSPEGEEQQV